ncbi:MAG: universal stress protein [Myxococcota bacterium]
MRFHHILATTDLTDNGDQAVACAFELAAEFGARVTLCHVLDALHPTSPMYAQLHPKGLFRPETQTAAESAARRALDERVPAPHAGVPHEIAVSHGQPADEIVRHAEERGCDLIVLTGGRRRHILGSVAEKVTRRARCAVLVMR